MKIVLPVSVSSPEDVLALTADIKRLSAASARAARSGSDVPVHADQPLSKDTLEFIRAYAHGADVAAELSALADGLGELYASAPRVVVTLAAPVTPALRDELTQWFRANVSPTMLVRAQVNRNILGGIVVRYGSHIHDWSFRTKLLENAPALIGALGVR